MFVTKYPNFISKTLGLSFGDLNILFFLLIHPAEN